MPCKSAVCRERRSLNVEEKKEFKLFREKSLEAVESPESLNDYLRVTSPGVWLILAAIVVILLGVIFWSVFGSINTTAHFAVMSSEGKAVCLVPYDQLEKVIKQNTVTVDGQAYTMKLDQKSEAMIITESANPYIRVAGKLNIGDVVVQVPVEGELADGVYTGEVQTEKLKPMSLLLN